MARKVVAPPQAPRLPDGSLLGGWWHEVDDGERIVCDLCPRACSLKPGDRGFCFVRENVDGQMVLSTYGHSTGFCVDPIEKKPLNHFLPGTAVLSFGTAGCNLGCKFCQNWDISKSREVKRASQHAAPATIAQAAVQLECDSVAFTYNDPVIWAEYAIDTAKACHDRGIKTVAVTAGYISPEARTSFYQDIDAANVDLKAFTEDFYQRLTYSHLEPVLDTLVWLKRETDVWFELTNLIIPQANDSVDEIRRMCDWVLAQLGDEIPIHFTAFHPDFRLRDRPATPLETLLTAYDAAKSVGVKYVYVGNVHDPVHDSTYCPHCSALLIERNWHELGAYHLVDNRCAHCDGLIAGRFRKRPGNWGRRRLPVRIANYAVPCSDPNSGDCVSGGPEPGKPALAPSSTAQGPARSARQPDPSSQGDKPMANTSDPHSPANNDASGDPQLTEHQELLVYRAACELIVAGVEQRPPNLPDVTLAGAADMTVMGVFVTLKRQGHLRACCGSLGRPMPLLATLRQAALRTATDDMRLPPISPTELPFLSLDVSLLSNFRPVTSQGTERVKDVAVGRHGLTIHRAQSGGLLLPSVAVENGWDAETFLRQVCRKAGLPSTVWQEDSTQLQTFEARVIEGQIDEDLLGERASGTPHLFTDEEVQQLASHCRTNIIANLRGATPNYYLPNCNDATVQGIALTVALPSHGLAPQFARLSMRPGLPLQATLYQLSESAAHWLESRQLPPESFEHLQTTLAVLYDSALHGTAANPDLRGLDPRRRALLVTERGRNVWLFDPAKTATELLDESIRAAQLLTPQLAGVFSFAVDANSPSFTVSNVPRPQVGPTVRRPAVAGTFYPDQSGPLDEMVDRLVAGSGASAPEPWPAVMVPHAGLRFSGRVAAQVFTQTAIPDRVIILAPKHTRLGTPWAVAPHETWAIPGHEVASDPELAKRLADGIPGLELDAAAHQDEHAIEVQLPLLARVAPNTRVVGITIGGGDLDHCRRFARSLADVLKNESSPPLLVISSDMNHYAEESENRRLDQIALDAIHQLDPAHVFETVREHDISMCGVLPAVIVLETLRELDALHTCRQVAYTTSAESSGNSDRVVGYAGMLFR